MKLIALTFFLLTLFFNLAIAKHESEDATLKNVPKPAPYPSRAPEPTFNINEACKDSASRAACESILKSLQADKQGHVKTKTVVEKVVRHAQNEFGDTATKVRKQMREDDLDMKIKKALSHCVKLYLDMADGLRGAYLAVRSKNYGSETTKFITMAHSFPMHCEEGLRKVGTSGEKLGLYENFKDLEDIASTMDAVIRYAKEGGKS